MSALSSPTLANAEERFLLFQRVLYQVLLLLALILAGGLTAVFVREWWHYGIAVLGYITVAPWFARLYVGCLAAWWQAENKRVADAEAATEQAAIPDARDPNWPFPRVDKKA